MKENSPLSIPQEKGFRLAVSIPNDLFPSGMEMPARGDAAFRSTIRFASAPTIRCCAAVGGSAALRMRHTPCGCRSAHLVEVRSNLRLPRHYSMRRAQQCRYFASSLPPSKRHSRLTTVRRGCCQVATRRDSWRSHVHRTYIAQRVQPFKLQTANAGGRGVLPSPFSGGFKGGILFGKRIPPLVSRRARRSPSRAYAGKGAALSGYPSLRATRGKHLRPCGRKKRAPLRVLFFKSLRISRTGTSGRLRR